MTEDVAIDAVVRRRVDETLTGVETANGVRVMLAVESGSRAWGFPSVDSDYDVRFVYVRPRADYLSIAPRRDVIETAIEDGLDISGWDLRKALQLSVRSNAVLIEWLASPVRYRDDTAATKELRTFVHAAARLAPLEYHYERLARRAFADIAAADEPPLKRYFYALRPALALHWLRTHGTPPPMNLGALIAGLDMPPAVTRTIAHLVRRKAATGEGERIARSPVADAFLEAALARTVPRPLERRDPTLVERADRFLASVLASYSDAP